MKTVKIRNLEIGNGMPKICVPIAGATVEEICTQAEQIKNSAADIVEWRSDYFEDIFIEAKRNELLDSLREKAGDRPLLFTFRTAAEGGRRYIEAEQYRDLNMAVAGSGKTDIIDVEVSSGAVFARDMIREAHENGIKVLASEHDFCRIPNMDMVIRNFKKMEDIGADIGKIAVMPKQKGDVFDLMEATLYMYENEAHIPLVAISMGRDGRISRIAGSLFGSAMTFGILAKKSAPGQISADELKTALTILESQ